MKSLSLSLVLSGALLAGPAMAQDLSKTVEARQAVMQLYAFNLGTLGGMARGNIDYDMDAAQAAAGNLAKLASMDQSALWVEGTAEGEVDGSKTLPALFEKMEDAMGHTQALAEAAMAAEAATDLAGVQAAMGGIGGSCGGCHKAYRASN